MTKLGEALRAKFRTPQAALQALGLDAALLDTNKEGPPMLTSVPAILTGFKAALKGKPKFAQDVDIDDAVQLLETVLGTNNNGDPVDLDQAPAPAPIGALPASHVASELASRGDMPAADAVRAARAADARRRLGRDETPEECAEREAADQAADAEEAARDQRPIIPSARDQDVPPAQPDLVTKSAMDAAIDAAVKKARADAAQNQREIRDAERFVAPWVGELAMAHDSAEAVYRTTLGALGKDHSKIRDPAALVMVIEAQPKPGTRSAEQHIAMDAATAKSFADRFPDAAKVRTI